MPKSQTTPPFFSSLAGTQPAPHTARTPKRLLFSSILSALIAACATPAGKSPELPAERACPTCPTCKQCVAPPETLPETPPAKPLQAARWSDLPGWSDDDMGAVWPAFLQSCRALAGKPQGALWRNACEDAKGMATRDAAELRRFFENRFEPWLLTNPDGTNSGMITGYYEPLLRGSRTYGKPYLHPLHAVPSDLLTIDLSDVLPELKNMRLRGRLQGNKIIPYYSRAEITGREKAKSPEKFQDKDPAERPLLWVDDPVELFFLQVQGSGRVKLPDGNLVRIGYADQNGHPYQSIGRWLVERGELKLEQASMQGIQNWARTHPARLDELLNVNPSYVFFKELPAKNRNGAGQGNGEPDGPPGALGVPLTPERSLAIDPRHVPLGAPVFLATTQPGSNAPLRRLMLAQDTGGAIRGVVRADFFWGFGAAAGNQAGRMKQAGQMWVLLPPGAAPK